MAFQATLPSHYMFQKSYSIVMNLYKMLIKPALQNHITKNI